MNKRVVVEVEEGVWVAWKQLALDRRTTVAALVREAMADAAKPEPSSSPRPPVAKEEPPVQTAPKKPAPEVPSAGEKVTVAAVPLLPAPAREFRPDPRVKKKGGKDAS